MARPARDDGAPGNGAPDNGEERISLAPISLGQAGITGMRERVAAARGQLTAGPVASGGGWSVVAQLPALADPGGAAA